MEDQLHTLFSMKPEIIQEELSLSAHLDHFRCDFTSCTGATIKAPRRARVRSNFGLEVMISPFFGFPVTVSDQCSPSGAAPIKKETSVERRGGGLQAAVFFPSSPWLEKRRPGGHRHGFQTITGEIPYPILDQ